MAANDPALKVNARAAKAEAPPQSPVVPNTGGTTATIVATDSGPGLVFTGPPRKVEPRRSAKTTVILVVFGLCAVSGGVFAWVQLRRRAIPTAAAPAKEKPIEGLEFKEESSHPPDTVLEA